MALFACDASVPFRSGLEEPLRVRKAQFLDGPLPAPAGGPAITNVSANSRLVRPGAIAKHIDGRAEKSASSIAMRLADAGSGYWVVPSGPRDGQYPNELTWTADMDYDFGLRPGFHKLIFEAISEGNVAGAPQSIDVCVLSRVPDNFHSCDPTAKVPDFVATLEFDEDSDVDLIVSTGSATADPQHPNRITGGTIDRDSLQGCQKDTFRQEDFIVDTKLPPGTSLDFYVGLFDPCGRPAVDFVLTLYEGHGELVQVAQKKGRLIAQDSINAKSPGLYALSYTFP